MRYLMTVLLLFGFNAVLVRADDEAVVIRSFTVIHTGKLSTENEEFVIQEVKSHDYRSSNLNEIALRVRLAFQRRGYFKVIAHDPVFNVVSRDTDREIVDVSVKVDEGEIYRLKNIAFTGSRIFSPPELRSQFRIADGDILDRDKVTEGLEGLRRIYVSKGYLKFSAVPETHIDENEHTISLNIDLDQGVREGDSSSR